MWMPIEAVLPMVKAILQGYWQFLTLYDRYQHSRASRMFIEIPLYASICQTYTNTNVVSNKG